MIHKTVKLMYTSSTKQNKQCNKEI